MKKSIQLIFVICILICNITYGQELSQVEVQKLADVLNHTMSKNIQLAFEKNQATLDWDGVSKTLDLRDDSEMTKDSMPKKKSQIKSKPKGRHLGPIFWIYNFEPTNSTKTSFRANKSGQLFFKFEFQEQDTININSRLNAYSCVHKTSDSSSHGVQWSGDKYISVLLQPEKMGDTIEFRARGITISGKFQRKDNIPIAKNYTKSLRTILKREFEELFNEMTFIDGAEKDFQVIDYN